MKKWIAGIVAGFVLGLSALPVAGVWDYSTTAGDNGSVSSITMSEGMAPSAVNDGVRKLMADVKEDWKLRNVAYTSSGTNTVTLTLTPTLSAYVDGQVITFIAGGTNTGATTLNIDTIGAKTIFAADGTSALAAGDITSGYLITVAYRSSLNGFQLLRSTSSAPGNFTVAGALSVTGASAFTGVASFADGSVTAPSITNTGDTNTGLYFPTADTVAIAAGGVDGLRVGTVASGVNYLQVTPAAANGVVAIAPAGSDTNIGLQVATKGTDPVQLYVGTLEAMRVQASASAVNYFATTASATGSALTFGAAGSDTNVGINIVPKGDGVLAVNGNTLTDASDNIPVARLNSGTSAGATTYWRGDGTWVNPFAGRTFTSTDQTITAGTSGNLTLAHNLSAAPFGYSLFLVAQATPELGYTEGDEVGPLPGAGFSGNTTSVSVSADATNVYVYPSSGLSIVVPDRSSSNANATITLSKWKFRVKAWL